MRRDILNEIWAVKAKSPDGTGPLLAKMCADGSDAGFPEAMRHIDVSGTIGIASSGKSPGEGFYYDNENDIAVAFSGRISNSLKLVREITERGDHMPEPGSARLIAHMYKRSGKAFIDHIHGHFRIIIWDGGSNGLYAFRDHAGTLPLYYSTGDNGIYGIASRPEALVESGAAEATLDYDAIHYFICDKAFAHGETPFRQVKALRAGEFIHIGGEGIRTGRHYSTPIKKEKLDEKEAIEKAESLLLDLLQEYIERIDRVGILFSGGVDSMLLLSMVKSVTDKPVHTYSVIIESAEKDNQYIENASKHFGTKHTNVLLNRDSFQGNVLELIRMYPEPAVGGWHVYLGTQAAGRDGVDFVISGFGGELVFGIPSEHRHLERIHRVLRQLDPQSTAQGKLLESIGALAGSIGGSSAPALIIKRYISLRTGVHKWYDSMLDEERAVKLFETERENFRRVREKYIADMAESGTGDLTDMLLYSRMKNFEGNKVLGKCDEVARCNNVEFCTPMLDRRMVEFGFSIPNAVKNGGGIFRKIEIEVSRRYHAFKREKSAFNAPIAEWLREGLPPEALAAFDEDRIREDGIFKPEELNYLWESFRGGRSDLTWTDLFSFISLHVWLSRIRGLV